MGVVVLTGAKGSNRITLSASICLSEVIDKEVTDGHIFTMQLRSF